MGFFHLAAVRAERGFLGLSLRSVSHIERGQSFGVRIGVFQRSYGICNTGGTPSLEIPSGSFKVFQTRDLKHSHSSCNHRILV